MAKQEQASRQGSDLAGRTWVVILAGLVLVTTGLSYLQGSRGIQVTDFGLEVTDLNLSWDAHPQLRRRGVPPTENKTASTHPVPENVWPNQVKPVSPRDQVEKDKRPGKQEETFASESSTKEGSTFQHFAQSVVDQISDVFDGGSSFSALIYEYDDFMLDDDLIWDDDLVLDDDFMMDDDLMLDDDSLISNSFYGLLYDEKDEFIIDDEMLWVVDDFRLTQGKDARWDDDLKYDDDEKLATWWYEDDDDSWRLDPASPWLDVPKSDSMLDEFFADDFPDGYSTTKDNE